MTPDSGAWVSRDDIRLHAEWNATVAAFPDVCVHHLVEAQARRTPDAIAVQFEAQAITYSQLNRRANQLARRFLAIGKVDGALVGLCVDRSIEMMVGMLGILKAGGAYVPLDPGYPADRLAFMMIDSGMRVLVTERGVHETLTIPPGVQTLHLDDPDIAPLDETDLARHASTVNPDSIAYVIYTSGSTGQPKGVLVPHRSVVNLLTSVRQRPGLSASDVVLAITTLSFDIAVSELLLPLTVGARIVLASRDAASDGMELLTLIRDAGVTFIDATPSTWRLLIDAGWTGSQTQTAICTGEAMPRDLAGELVERAGRVWNGYGPTETTVWSTFFEVTRPVERILIGTPIANTRIHILDDRMQPVAVGVPGELYIAGAGVARGYLNRPDLTRDRFVPDPFDESGATMYRTGDLGRYLHDGQIECLGRNDDQVKIRGFRIELGEIEEALAKHDAVARAAVIAREDRPGDLRLVGYCVLRDGRVVTDAALRAHLRRFLPEYMVPVAFVRLDALPLTPSGKVNRRDLPAPPPIHTETDVFVSPRTPTERVLAGLWRQALGLERVGVDEDFFALGGHSLLASHVLARLRRDHGIEVPFRTLFEAPTIEQLAAHIGAHARSTEHAHRAIGRRAAAGASRLSVAQERMWLLETMDPRQRVVHNLPCAWRLRGALDAGALERSVNAIVARHGTLRTRITVRNGVPFQEVAPAAAIVLRHVDLRPLPEPQREAAMLASCDIDAQTPHDLSVAPLFRASLIRMGESEHVLFIVPHNLIWDGWSFDIFLRELCAQYAASIDGRPSPLPDLAISYPDFAGWQSEWIGSDQSAAQRGWWQTQLDGTLPILELPSDRPRPAEPTLAATHIQTRLSRDQVQALSAISGQSGGTLFTILFAAFCVLVHRLSGKNDLLIGTPVHARTRPETEDLIGLFMNMLVLRSRIDLAWTFTELLGHVRHMTLDAFGHQELPLEALDVRAPILRAFFTMEDGRQRPGRMGRLEIAPVSVMPPALAADLRLAATHTTDGVSIVWTCSSELFDSATTKRLLRRFEALLGDVIRDPRRRLGELDMMSGEERALLDTFGHPAPSAEPAVCVHTQFEHQARRRPDAAAIVSGSDVIEYGRLNRRAANLSRALEARGIRDGSRIGVYLPRSTDFVTAVLAAMKAGAIWVPLDPDDPPARIAAILEHSGVELVVTSDSLRNRIAEGATPLLSTEEAGRTYSEATEPAAGSASAARIDTPVCLLYTTHVDRLRAATLSHRTLAALVEAVTAELGLTECDVALAINSPSLDASIIELLAPLSVGARVVLAGGDAGLDAEELAATMTASAATFVMAPTSLWADALVATAESWPHLKAVCVGGLPAGGTTADLLSRTAGAWIAHGFPEAGIWITLGRLSDSQPASFLGRPLRHVPLRILEAGLAEAPLGVAGELHVGVGGDLWADAETQGARGEGAGDLIQRLDGSWYRTGERARWRTDGTLELVAGRNRETYVGGFRVDLEDISSLLRRQLPVQDAAASFQAADADHRRLVAYLAPREGVSYTATELREQLRRVLPERMVPRSFIEVETIVRTADGGLELESRGAAGVLSGDDDASPVSATEILLAELWKDALCVPRVGVHDNFFELGGYSLLCFQVLDRLERRTGHRVSPRLLLLDSLQQIAAQLDAIPKAGDEHQSPKEPSTRGGFFRRLGRFLPGAP